MLGLLFSGRFAQSQTCEDTELNPNNAISGINPNALANGNLFRSVCNTQGHFANSWFHTNLASNQEIKEVDQLRGKYWSNMQPKLAALEAKLESVRKGLFPDYKQFNEISGYFRKIARTAEAAKIRRHESSGFCGEATAASIVNSLLAQIQEGYRQSVQHIVIETADKKVNHAFVLYNSEPLKSQKITNQRLKEILNLTPSQNEDTRVICDEFDHFHGAASEWFDNFFNSKEHNYGDFEYVNIKVTDYSLPTFRGNYNAKQRKFIKEELISLLKEVKRCNKNENMAECNSNNTNELPSPFLV